MFTITNIADFWPNLITKTGPVVNLIWFPFLLYYIVFWQHLCCPFLSTVMLYACWNSKLFLTKCNNCFCKMQIVNCIMKTQNTVTNQNFLHIKKSDWEPVHYSFWFSKKKSKLIDLKVFPFSTYTVQTSLITNDWNQNSRAQQRRFSWIFLTIFVKTFLAGLNDATISSICWILQTHESVKYYYL